MDNSEIFAIGLFDESDSDFAPLVAADFAPVVEPALAPLFVSAAQCWSTTRLETQALQNAAFKSYDSLTQIQARTAFQYIRS